MTISGNLSLVFTGNVANDGTGDTLRKAFTTMNSNTANLIIAMGDPLGSSVLASNIISNSSGISFGIATPTIIDSFYANVYRSARYIASVSGSQYQTSEILLIQDGTNVALNVVTVSFPTGSVTFTANIDVPSTGNVSVWASSTATVNVLKLQKIYVTV